MNSSKIATMLGLATSLLASSASFAAEYTFKLHHFFGAADTLAPQNSCPVGRGHREGIRRARGDRDFPVHVLGWYAT